MNAVRHTGILLLISAPSGGGKTTVCSGLLEACPRLRRVVTCTTRTPRPGEVEGVDYHFLPAERFAAEVEAGAFLEHATVYGNRYGTQRAAVLATLNQGEDVLLNIDVQGAASVRAVASGDPGLRDALVTVFLTPATLRELESRLRGRGSDSEEMIQRRLAAASGEVAEAVNFDYLLVSGTREEDLQRARAVYAAEKIRRHRVRFEFGA